MFLSLIAIKGAPVGADNVLTLSYLHTSAGAHDRFLVNDTISVPLTDEVSLQLSAAYANRSEFVDAREVRGNVGLSFSFQDKKK